MEPYLGEIRMFAGNFAPSGWQLCNGQLLSISQYSALFAILGTTYGGNGTTTFALPNLQSRIPLHWGTGPGLSNYVIGEATGVENVTLLQNQMPIHTHMVNSVSVAADQGSPKNFYPSASNDPSDGNTINTYSDANPDSTLNPATIGTAGGSIPFSVLQPVLAVTFIIAMVGIFPSRN
jgi:microcystin-dependent protein